MHIIVKIEINRLRFAFDKEKYFGKYRVSISFTMASAK